MPFLLLEKRGVTGLHPERRHERVLVRERIPAKRDEVEDEALWRDPCPLRCRCQRGDGVVYWAAEELGDAASIPERLALDEPDEVLIVAEKVEERADVRLDRILGWAVIVALGVGTCHRFLAARNGARYRFVQGLFAAEEVRGVLRATPAASASCCRLVPSKRQKRAYRCSKGGSWCPGKCLLLSAFWGAEEAP
jgi:hypothetical protein